MFPLLTIFEAALKKRMSIIIKCSHENISLPFKKLLSPLIHTIAMRSGLQLRWVIFRSQLETQSSLFSPWFMAREEGRMNTMRPWYTLKSPFAPNATGHMLFLCSYTDVLHNQTIIKYGTFFFKNDFTS